MRTTVIGAFSDTASAEHVVDMLADQGFHSSDIGVIAKEGVIKQPLGDAEVAPAGARVAEGAVSGATAGGVIGGLAGLVIGLTAITIPGLGALLIGGPIAAALGLTGAAATTVSAATTGALAGGLIGALGGLGLSKEAAQVYEERVKSGGVVLVVPVKDEMQADMVEEILESGGAEDVTRANAPA